MTRTLPELIKTLGTCKPHVCVIGDLILDRFISGNVERISPEAPVPVLELSTESFSLGGAANVANNLACLGATVDVVGLVGMDAGRDRMVQLFEEARVGTRGMMAEAGRPTTTKTRVSSLNQQIVRIDHETRAPMSRDTETAVLQHLEEVFPALSAIVVSDYGKGVVTQALLDGLRQLVRNRPVPIIVDPKNPDFSVYRDFTLITPNQGEAGMGAGFKIKDELTLVEAGYKLRASLNLGAVLVTRGPAGMSLFQKGKEVLHIPSVVRNVYDVTGAGDTVTAVMALGLAAGMDFPEAANLSNYAAGVVVGKFGTATVTLDELAKVSELGG